MASVQDEEKSVKDGETASELVASGKESVDPLEPKPEVAEKESVDPLEPKPEVADKSVGENSTPGKDAGTSQQVQTKNKKKRKRRKVIAKKPNSGVNDAGNAPKHLASEKPAGNSLKPEPERRSSQQVQNSEKPTDNSLKPGPEITEKSVAQNSVPRKGDENSQQVQDRKKKNKKQIRKDRGKETKHGEGDAEKHLINPHENKGKKKRADKHEETNRSTHSARKELGGVIFLCNGKTKQDCFRYRIMGVSTSKKDLVLSIRPGLKLFLFDFDLKLMYGIFKASSAGGMKLEPAAFGGAFPVQVRFDIEQDCLPIPESVLKRTLSDCYNERTRKFNTELTFVQVKQLSKLFKPAPQLQPNLKSFVPEPVVVVPIQPPPAVSSSNKEMVREQIYRDHYNRREDRGRVDPKQFPEQYGSHSEAPSHPLFFGEKEYRSHGLQPQPGRHPLPTVSAAGFDYAPSQGREQLTRNTAGNGDATRPEPFFPTERDYRTYGLRGMAPIAEPNLALEDRSNRLCNPYDESTTSLVNRYLSMPRVAGVDAGSFPLTERETFRRDDSREAYRNDSSYINERRGPQESYISDRGRPYPPYDVRAPPPDYNQRHLHVGGEPDRVPASVSSRYAFYSPSAPRR